MKVAARKRPSVDLAALTADTAEPMMEASQRRAAPPTTPNLEALAFKVPATFRKRFRQAAVEADLKLNELLFEALDAWEEKRRGK
jgi:hypothetical protein